MTRPRTFRFLVVLAFWAPAASAQSPFMFTCAEGTHIEAAKRQAIDSVARDYLQKMLGPNPDSAFDLMSEEGKANVTIEQLSTLSAIMRQLALTNIAVRHTYFIVLKGKSPGSVVCATDLTKPDGWETLGAASVPEQAHVAMSAETTNNQLAFTLWLVPEQKTWKVQSSWMNVATLATQDSAQLWQSGRAQHAKGHNFNAALFFGAASQLANRGPNFRLGITQSISEDLSKLDIPPEVQGSPPFSWKNGEKTYKVLNVGPIAVGGKIYVITAYEVLPWQSNEQVEGWNQEFLSYFKRRFPEYADAFAGVVVRAIERGSNRGYGTVEELPPSK